MTDTTSLLLIFWVLAIFGAGIAIAWIERDEDD